MVWGFGLAQAELGLDTQIAALESGKLQILRCAQDDTSFCYFGALRSLAFIGSALCADLVSVLFVRDLLLRPIKKLQVPFGFAQGRLLRSIRFADSGRDGNRFYS